MHRPLRYLGLLFVVLFATDGRGQVIEQITFQTAIERAIANNPTVQQAATGILQAQAILQQVRAESRPAVDAAVAHSIIGPVTSFNGTNVTPRAQTQSTVELSVPILVPVLWAQRNQAADQIVVAERATDDTRRAVAVATAQTYLAILASRRIQELNERARDNARAHFEYAEQRLAGGVGNRLNVLRAQQELSFDEARVEGARLAVRQAQEALGVLVAADGPVDAADEPQLDVPADALETQPAGTPAGASPLVVDLNLRPDIRLLAARQAAAERVLRDSRLDYLPTVSAVVTPQHLTPSGLFVASRSWRVGVLFNVPLLDSGLRSGQAQERRALVDSVRAERTNAERQAGSEIRTAREAVAASLRALVHARQSADYANEVLGITDVVFREGASTNIEVLDAQRQARDAETQAVVAEDSLRRARLDLLVALGRFPAGN
jgi:outer membrane protein TolC